MRIKRKKPALPPEESKTAVQEPESKDPPPSTARKRIILQKPVPRSTRDILATDGIVKNDKTETVYSPDEVDEMLSSRRKKQSLCFHPELRIEYSVSLFEEECERHQVALSVECKKCGCEFVFDSLPVIPQKSGAYVTCGGTVVHLCATPAVPNEKPRKPVRCTSGKTGSR